jgi:predicted nucleic acid-binding protein
VLYLDTSALVKTVLVEQESSMLSAFLREDASLALLTSALSVTELARAVTVSIERGEFPSVAPEGGLVLVQERLDGLRIVAITTELLQAAGHVKPPRLRTPLS